MPAQLSRLGIESHHTIRIEVIAAPLIAVSVRKGIAGGPVQQSRFGIVGSGQPGCRASGIERRSLPGFRTRLAAFWQRSEAPGELTGGSFVSGYESLEWSVAA